MTKTQKLKFSPSHSYRWLNCPGSAQLIAKLPPEPSSPHAMEGTAAHEVAANCLKNNQDACEWVGEVIEIEDRKFKVTEATAEAVQIYLDAIRNDLDENGIPHKELAVEQKFEIAIGDKIIGTNDASFSSYLGKLYVYDYKHGAGTYVDVENNTQLMIYAAGAMAASGWINEVAEIVIVQPRFRPDEVAPVRRWEILQSDLVEFIAECTMAVEACKKKDAKCIPGAWCKKSFCQAQGVCPAIRGEVVEATGVVEVSGTLQFPDPAKLTPEQIARVMSASDLIAGWVSAVKGYAQSQAECGIKIPGHKLIRKYGNRAWVDEMAVENEFEPEFGDDIYEKKLMSPSKLEKLVGKDRVIPLVSKPYKGVELVHENAKGEEVLPEGAGVFKKLEGGEE